jgi:hypothetical protein
MIDEVEVGHATRGQTRVAFAVPDARGSTAGQLTEIR